MDTIIKHGNLPPEAKDLSNFQIGYSKEKQILFINDDGVIRQLGANTNEVIAVITNYLTTFVQNINQYLPCHGNCCCIEGGVVPPTPPEGIETGEVNTETAIKFTRSIEFGTNLGNTFDTSGFDWDDELGYGFNDPNAQIKYVKED
jgi:hypothetical protein